MIINRKRVLWNSLALLLTVLVFFAFYFHLKGFLDKEKLSGHLSDVINQELQNADDFLEEKHDLTSIREFAQKEPYRDFFILENDSVSFYTNNQIILEEDGIQKAKTSKVSVINTPNRVVLSKKYSSSSDSTLVFVVSLKHQYPISNSFLNSTFIIDNSIPKDLTIQTKRAKYNVEINDQFVFSIENDKHLSWSDVQSHLIFGLFLIFYIMLYVFLFVLYDNIRFFKGKSALRLLLFLADTLIVLFLFRYFKFPDKVFEMYLFNHGTFIFPGILYGIGDALIYLIPVLVLSWAAFKWVSENNQLLNRRHKLLSPIFFAASILPLYYSYATIENLVFNSTISIEISKPVQLGFESMLGLGLMAISLIASLLISTSALLCLNQIFRKHRSRIGIVMLGLIITTGTAIFFNWLYGFIVLQFLALGYFISIKNGKVGIYFVLSLLFISALGYSIIISNKYQVKQNKEIELRAMRILNNRDRILESRFASVYKDIQSDPALSEKAERNLSTEDIAEIKSYLMNEYLTVFENKYDISITICDSITQLVVNYDDNPVNCYGYFNSIIENVGEACLSEGLYYIDDDDKIRKYLARIPVDQNLIIFADIFQKSTPFAQGYPELLVNEEAENHWLTEYDYGIYRDSMLISSYGDFNYPLHFHKGFLKDSYEFSHHIFQDGKKRLVITKTESLITDALAGISYLFILLGALFLVLYLLIIQHIDLSMFTKFRSRLQIWIFTILLMAFIVIGYFVFNHISLQNTQKNISNLRELSHSILIELEHKFASLDAIDEVSEEYAYSQLIKFSNVFFSDIHLYDTTGRLYASSRQEVFDQHILSEYIHRDAYGKMKRLALSQYIIQENIGDYEFLSSYFPLRNYENEIIAYVNLPYFAKQRRLTEEISAFLTTFINIYVILTGVALFLIWIISNYITKPMQTIKKSLSQTALSQSNVKIDIQRNDEIGELVREYNKMVDELEKSARKLMETERESAWREMAKQVAHEIKNPLTPMKLSVQHLSRVVKPEDEESRKNLNRFSENMINQIESLSEIASAFSDFAKMPSVKFKKIDVNKVIENTLELFRGTKNIEFHFDEQPGCFIEGDEKQLERVLINLLKNAVQALYGNENGIIKLTTQIKGKNVNIYIEDNGTGIKNEQINKIFLPNFTTKSGGTGLGLAMVKNIIHSFKGTIELLKTSESGTLFLIQLPLYEETSNV